MKKLIVCLILILLTVPLFAQKPSAQPQPALQVSLGNSKETLSIPLQVLVLLTLLTFLPAMLISVTSFTRIIVVAHFIRQALGTQSAPNNQILLGLSLFLTFFIMGPTWDQIYQNAVTPYEAGSIGITQAAEQAVVPIRTFMLKQVRESDLALFVKVAGLPQPKNAAELPLRVIVPAFMISELKTAFQIGFVLFLPFLVIDMVISSVLLSIGMMQLPPIVISTPFKILLFVLVDGWHLVLGSLIRSFH